MSNEKPPYARYTYVFGPRESFGVVLGLGWGSIMAVFVALFALTGLASAGGVRLLVGLLLLAATVAAVWVPVANRTLAQWIPIAVAFGVRRATGMAHYRGGPAAETRASPADMAATSPGRADGPPRNPQRHASKRRAGRRDAELLPLPGELAGLELLTAHVGHAAGQLQVGVIKDRRRGLYTMLLSTRGSAFGLLTAAEQDTRLAHWGETLASVAGTGTGIVRLQLLNLTVPDSADALVRHWHADGRRGNAATGDSYAELLNTGRAAMQRHETYVGLTLSPRRARRQIRTLGGGDRGACAHLIQQAASVQAELINAGVEVEGALPPRQIAALLRTAYEPGARWQIEARGPDMQRDGGVNPAEAGPMAADGSHWSYYRTDDAFHAIFWVSEWPRRPVTGDFLQPLLLTTRCERAISVVMEPLDARHAEDEIAQRETAKASNSNLQARLGFRTGARQRREQATLHRQDEALAAGHALFRFIGLIRISAPTVGELDRACAEVEMHARGLRLRRLYGEQDAAFVATLPLGRGLRWGALR